VTNANKKGRAELSTAVLYCGNVSGKLVAKQKLAGRSDDEWLR